jgi:phosphohistidine swiveling domain-containing protein
VVCTLAEATNVLPGEVLVVREPLFELSPWFGVASAVVAETGWLLDDAAVLAREYGVPAIFRVQGATERIRNGEELQVDANRGMVIRRPVEQDWDFL